MFLTLNTSSTLGALLTSTEREGASLCNVTFFNSNLKTTFRLQTVLRLNDPTVQSVLSSALSEEPDITVLVLFLKHHLYIQSDEQHVWIELLRLRGLHIETFSKDTSYHYFHLLLSVSLQLFVAVCFSLEKDALV